MIYENDLINQLELSTFSVDACILLLGTVVVLIVGVLVAFISGMLFLSVDVYIEIYDDLKVQHVPRN